MRLAFWGTPEFALPSFRALLGEGHEIVAVITQPDRPAGRRRELRPPPVKLAALEEHIPIAQPEKARGPEFLAWLAEREAELNVVVAYGQILRPEVLESAPRGSINLHASLLPELRGAAPVQWAIARGYTMTGVTVIRMDAGMDTGPILLQVPEPIDPDETARELGARLSEIGAEALVHTLALMEIDELTETPQDESKATYAPLITREHARIDWARSAEEVSRQIRAFDDQPGAWTSGPGGIVKLYRPMPAPAIEHGREPGVLLSIEPANPSHGVLVACGTGTVWIREVQPAGKRRMTAVEWLRGRRIEAGARFH